MNKTALFALAVGGAFLCRPAPTLAQQPPQQTYYYCDDLQAYYPAAPTCPSPWKAVPVHPGPAGVGMRLTVSSGKIIVAELAPEKPAAIAGVREGDCVTQINNMNIFGMAIEQVLDLLRGDVGSEVNITTRHADGTTQLFTLRRADISNAVYRPTTSIPQQSDTPPDISQLLEKEHALNNRCRGGSGDDPATIKACEQRDAVFDQLTAKGWCYGEANQAGYQKEWHKCGASPKNGRSVVARAVGPAPGAIVCPDYQKVTTIFHLYARHWEEAAQDTYTKGQSELIRGKAMPAPDPAAFGCILVEPGTPMILAPDNAVPMVEVRLPSGKLVRGVTLPAMFANE